MSRLDPPRTLLDLSFLEAIVDLDSPRHGDAVAAYREMIDEYEDERILLSMLDVDFAQLGQGDELRRTLLAPVQMFWTAGQHRRAAATALVTDTELALRMVVVLWEGMARVATFDERWTDVDVTVIPSPVDDNNPL